MVRAQVLRKGVWLSWPTYRNPRSKTRYRAGPKGKTSPAAIPLSKFPALLTEVTCNTRANHVQATPNKDPHFPQNVPLSRVTCGIPINCQQHHFQVYSKHQTMAIPRSSHIEPAHGSMRWKEMHERWLERINNRCIWWDAHCHSNAVENNALWGFFGTSNFYSNSQRCS